MTQIVMLTGNMYLLISFFSDENVCHIIRDLFVAGTENVSIALQWLMAFMVNYPEVQDRCRDTIKDVSCLTFVHYAVK